MPIKMIVTDLDGTLLRSDKTISDYTVSVLKKCKANGILLVIATARPIHLVKPYMPQLNCDASIYHNGAIVDCKDGSQLNYGIDFEIAKRILMDILNDNPQTTLAVNMDDQLYANFDASEIWKGVAYIRSDFTDLPCKEVDKILVGATSSLEIERFSRYLPDNLYIQMSENIVGMVMNRRATKMEGIVHICNVFGISGSEVVAFGDDHNDIEMLKSCGIGVAVENAISEAKLVSNQVCGCNDNDGVAKWIEQNLL